MPVIIIPNHTATRAAEFCIANLGPKKYHLHNQVGGVGWFVTMRRGAEQSTVSIDNEDFALLFALSVDYS